MWRDTLEPSFLTAENGRVHMNILVSHCFMGEPCRYDGQSRLDRQIIELHRAGHNLIPVCPEVLGGLETPRPPAELQPDGRVLTREGEDVTSQYRAGAERVLAIARERDCDIAILKARSPSCGSGEVYDGSFTGTLTPGWGVAARLLSDAGIEVIDEEHLPAWLYQ